jgi:hypothetical protein
LVELEPIGQGNKLEHLNVFLKTALNTSQSQRRPEEKRYALVDPK